MADKMKQKKNERPKSTGFGDTNTTQYSGAKESGAIEKFPAFTLQRQPSNHKPKSLSETNVLSQIPLHEDLTSAIDRIKSAPPPDSLDEARSRRASEIENAREIRKASINFIRGRTASRVEASANAVRPSLESPEPSE